MKFYTYIFLLFALLGCNSNQKTFDNKNNLNQLIDAYLFLSENHDLLHIMMGEYEGSPIEAYREYQEKIAELKNNNHLKPIFHGLNNIEVINKTNLKNADKFDALVDYYQMGIQIIIEGILKGYGYLGKIPENSDEYKKIKSTNL
tara:strand:+ start:299 stop:733 length:435 start_codon:yes stop_codon:yes gene_type:complete